jgi:CRP-like cAMP-binding protein
MPDALTRKPMKPSTKGRAVSFPEGANLFEGAHKSRQIFFVNAGQVRLTGRNGVIFDHLKRGAFFGEKSLLDANSNHDGAVALSAVDAIAFRKADLPAIWRRDPAFALRLVKDLALRLDRYEELICDLVTEQAEMRLVRLLVRTAPARPAKGWVKLPFRFTNVELARMIGTTRWRVSFLLNRFQRLGWLRRDSQLWLHREGAAEYLATH